MKYRVMFDVGGTGIKHALVNEKSEIVKIREPLPAPSKESKERVFSLFASIINDYSLLLPPGDEITGVGMAWPGPFDFVRGISLMDGLGKYQSILGLSVEEGIKKALGEKWEKLDFRFTHDVAGFLLGYAYSTGWEKERMISLLLGTGAGSAFFDEGKCVGSEEPGVPENGWIYNCPFRDGTIEDWLSSKGIEKLSLKYFGERLTGKELSSLAEEGKEKALSLWREFGEIIKEGIMSFVDVFHPSSLVFGGTISKAWPYFSPSFGDAFSKRNVRLERAEDTSQYVFYGLSSLFREK